MNLYYCRTSRKIRQNIRQVDFLPHVAGKKKKNDVVPVQQRLPRAFHFAIDPRLGNNTSGSVFHPMLSDLKGRRQPVFTADGQEAAPLSLSLSDNNSIPPNK